MPRLTTGLQAEGVSALPVVTVNPCVQLSEYGGEVVVNIEMPDLAVREGPVDVCCVVDISASIRANQFSWWSYRDTHTP